MSAGIEALRAAASGSERMQTAERLQADAESNAGGPREEPPVASPPVDVLIKATSGWRALNLRELWRYRDLVYFLTMREISVRHKQTILGPIWAILHPVLTAGLFTALFAMLMGRGRTPTIPGVPYFVATLAVMLPWQLFAHSMNNSGNSLVKHQRLITKVYFPRLVVPLSASLAGLADFAVASLVVVGAFIYCGIPVTLHIVWLPLFLLLAVFASLAVGLWLSALNAMYRDIQHVLPFLVQVGMLATPVVYTIDKPRDALPAWAFNLYCLNPMVGVTEGIRWSLFSAAEPPGLPLFWSMLVTVSLFISGAMYFRRMERTFADVV